MVLDFCNTVFKIFGQEAIFQTVQCGTPTVVSHGLPTTCIGAAVPSLLWKPEAPALPLPADNQLPV